MGSQPVKNLDDLMTQQSRPPPGGSSSNAKTGLSFNPFIYGNDIDSVDIATRVAMVSAVPFVPFRTAAAYNPGSHCFLCVAVSFARY